jgi:ADP-heptose:LPS heptosyltransferase
MPSLKSKLKNKILIKFFLFIKKFQKKREIFNPKNPRILIISTTALGDTLWATPSIEAIKKKYKTSYLAILCSKKGREVLENNPFLDKIFTLKTSLLLSFIPLFIKLKKEKFQAILIFHSSQRLTLPLCSILNSEYLISSKDLNKDLDIFLTHNTNKNDMHEIERRFEILKKINIEKKNKKMSFFIKKEKLNNFKNLKNKKYLIIFHPGAKDSFRRWPPKSFITLGNLLNKNFNCNIAITGNKREKKLIKTLSSSLPFSFPIYENLSINKLAILIKNANLLITNDTGPLHLACALETNLIGLFVPSNPKQFGPYRVKNALTLKKEKPCLHCIKRKCKDPFCWLQIKPIEVFEECKKFLKK